MLFHEEEKGTTFVLQGYLEEHPGAKAICLLKNGNRVLVSFFSAYESDNEDLDLDAPYDEFNVLSLKVEKVLTAGNPPLKKADIIDVWYNNFPVEVVDQEGNIIFVEK